MEESHLSPKIKAKNTAIFFAIAEGMAVFNCFVLMPLYTVLSNDVLLADGILCECLYYLRYLAEYLLLFFEAAALIYGSFRYGARGCKPLYGAVAGVLFSVRLFNLASDWVPAYFGGVLNWNEMGFDLLVAAFYLLFDALTCLLTVIIAFAVLRRARRRYDVLRHALDALEQTPFCELDAVYPFAEKHRRLSYQTGKSPLLLAAIWCAAVAAGQFLLGVVVEQVTLFSYYGKIESGVYLLVNFAVAIGIFAVGVAAILAFLAIFVKQEKKALSR